MGNNPDIKRLRDSIDTLDRELIELLSKRALVAREIGDYKRDSSLPFHDPQREEAVLQKLRGYNQDRFPDRALVAVYQEIFGACLSLEEPLQVAVAGTRNGYTHEAALQRFGISCLYHHLASVRSALDKLAAGEASYLFLPFENSLRGLNDQVLDALAHSPFPILEEVMISPRPVLYGFESGSIPFVAGEPEILAVAERQLAEIYPGVRSWPVDNLREVAEKITRDRSGLLLAGEILAREFDLPRLPAGLQAIPNNIDRFLVLGRDERSSSGGDKTSLFADLPNQPGSLQKLLSIFASHRIDLLALDSRPRDGLPWEYRFFLELEGHSTDPLLRAALAEVADLGYQLSILGSYPRLKEGENGVS
jgi:chorismate mutase / prephenate dehydratase